MSEQDNGLAFLSALSVFDDSDNDDENNDTLSQEDVVVYKDRKPRWWKQLAGRRGSKAQRRALAEMSAFRLPTVPYGAFLDWNNIFPQHNEIWFEIGSGQGDNLLANAERHPNKLMIGADVHRPGVGMTLLRIKHAQTNHHYWNNYTTFSNESQQEQQQEQDNPYSNVRIHNGDGMKLLRCVPTSSLAMVLMTFPDPWERYKQHRLIQRHTVRDLFRVLRAGGCFCLATDHPVYLQWCKDVFDQEPFCSVPTIPRHHWLPAVSKYEQKGRDAGREIHLACWQNTKNTTN